MIYFFRCSNEDDYSLAVPYYKMARVLPAEVLKRVKKIQEQSGNHVIFLLFVLLLKKYYPTQTSYFLTTRV